jgi:hypothetical protein
MWIVDRLAFESFGGSPSNLPGNNRRAKPEIIACFWRFFFFFVTRQISVSKFEFRALQTPKQNLNFLSVRFWRLFFFSP